MMCNDKSCPGFHFNKPDDSPRIKFHQEVGFPALSKNGYIFWKDVIALATTIDQFNKKFPSMTDQSCPSKPVAKRVSEDTASDHVSARRVHSPSIHSTELPPHPPLKSRVPPSPPEKNLLLLKNQAAPMPTSNGYVDLYSSNSDNNPVFDEMVSNDKTVNSIHTYSVYGVVRGRVEM